MIKVVKKIRCLYNGGDGPSSVIRITRAYHGQESPASKGKTMERKLISLCKQGTQIPTIIQAEERQDNEVDK